jgi:6-phosphofructokinase 1
LLFDLRLREGGGSDLIRILIRKYKIINSEVILVAGNLLVGQSGGPTAVINNSLCGVIETAQRNNQIKEIYGALGGIEGVLREEIVDLGMEKPETIRLLSGTPAAALSSCRYKLDKDKDLERILEVFKAHDIRYFFYIGGNDSADTSHEIAKAAKDANYELFVIGIPKTMDNDLVLTDHCPGYPSAARYIAIETLNVSMDAFSLKKRTPVTIIETLGRDSGWVAAASALAKFPKDKGQHLIYLPERPFEQEIFLQDVKKAVDTKGWVLVVVSEGLKDKNGKFISEKGMEDSFGHKVLGGVSDYLESLLKKAYGFRIRCNVPGTGQRAAIDRASDIDLEEAYLVGKAAVQYALKGESDGMVILVRESNEPYSCTTALAPLDEIANKVRPFPDNWINKEGNFVTAEFMEYVQPLVGKLPEYTMLQRYTLKKLLQ